MRGSIGLGVSISSGPGHSGRRLREASDPRRSMVWRPFQAPSMATEVTCASTTGEMSSPSSLTVRTGTPPPQGLCRGSRHASISVASRPAAAR